MYSNSWGWVGGSRGAEKSGQNDSKAEGREEMAIQRGFLRCLLQHLYLEGKDGCQEWAARWVKSGLAQQA